MRTLTITSTMIVLSSSLAFAGPELIELPTDYKDAFTHYLSRDRGNPKQIAEIFANPVALESAKDGAPLDYGSILVMEIWKAKMAGEDEPVLDADGRRIKDGLAAIVVMEKEQGWGADYPDEIRNGEWEFAAFKPDGSRIERDFGPCFECHKPLEDQDYVQSYEELVAAAKGE